jgi:NAD(P)H-hydrate epimerase
MKIVTAEQMRNIDRRATERFGVPSIVLMENAAAAVVDAVFEHFADAERIAIFCGTGQNGGDGFAIARHLENRGVVPIVFVVGDRSHCTGDAATNLAICERLSLPMYDVTDADSLEDALVHAGDADVVVDAIFGTGLNRPAEGVFADTIRSVNELGLPIVAVDVPSGMNASSSTLLDPAIRAMLTVTFAAPKVCHVFEPAAVNCGEVVVADICIPTVAIDDENATLALTTPGAIRPHLAPRLALTHKGTYGHVAIVAGSPGKSGAAVLCARGAIRTGAGLVTVLTDREAATAINAASIESMTMPLDLLSSLPEVLQFVRSKSVVVIGPGLRDDEESYAFVRELVRSVDRPLILDASGLNAFAGRAKEINPGKRPTVITPHPGEMSRLLGKSIDDRIETAREAARVTHSVVVLKGHQTLIADPEGHVNVNPTGNPGMASGGMGDVLGGMIAAFVARGVDPFDAAVTAVYLHGYAADLIKDEMGDTGMAAMDVAGKIPLAIQRLR